MRDFDSIPDDVWLSIFENISDSWQHAQIVRTCSRFRVLAIKMLLRDLRWKTDSIAIRNVESWKSVLQNYSSLPRTLEVGLTYKVKTDNGIFDCNDFDIHTYDIIHHHIPSFTMLEELVFKETTFSPIAYRTIAALPNLKRVSITNCQFVPLNKHWPSLPLLDDVREPFNDFLALPLTHLTLSQNRMLVEMPHSYHLSQHPFHIATALTLRFLSIDWTSNASHVYNNFKWTFPSLQELDVVVNILSRDLIDSLVAFVKRCPSIPRLKLKVAKHNMPDTQINVVHFPLRGVDTYEGPLSVAVLLSGENDLGHVVLNETMDLLPLLSGLERLSFNLRTLDLQIRKWDAEVLFAIRQLFRQLESLSIRFGNGSFPENFMVMLGSDILPDLHSLRSIKIFLDSSCIVHTTNPHTLHTFYNFNIDEEDATPEPSLADTPHSTMEYSDLKDYLVGWNRYCPNLRLVQLSPRECWSRRYEGDEWVENAVYETVY